MSLSVLLTLGLFLAGAVAGFVDAIAGGGGLLTVPVLWLTGIDPHCALATNKGQSVFGSGMALFRYQGSDLLDRRRALQSFIPALLAAVVGATVVSQLATRILTPLVMVLLLGVALFMIFQRPHASAKPQRRRSFILGGLVAAAIAFYDGFFGPGTGTFLIMAYVWLWHDPLDQASANAKVVNFASNLASVITFARKGLILWHYAIPMAIGQAMGGYLGAHLTVKVGRSLVRYFVIVVCLGLLVSLAWRLISSSYAPGPDVGSQSLSIWTSFKSSVVGNR